MAGAGSAQRERAKEERGVESSLSVCNRRQSRVHVDDGICVSASELLHSWLRPPPHDAGLRRASWAGKEAGKQRFLNASLELDDTSGRKPLISSLLEV